MGHMRLRSVAPPRDILRTVRGRVRTRHGGQTAVLASRNRGRGRHLLSRNRGTTVIGGTRTTGRRTVLETRNRTATHVHGTRTRTVTVRGVARTMKRDAGPTGCLLTRGCVAVVRRITRNGSGGIICLPCRTAGLLKSVKNVGSLFGDGWAGGCRWRGLCYY